MLRFYLFHLDHVGTPLPASSRRLALPVNPSSSASSQAHLIDKAKTIQPYGIFRIVRQLWLGGLVLSVGEGGGTYNFQKQLKVGGTLFCDGK